MSAIDFSDEWKLSAPEREQLRKEKSRFLNRIRDERELRLFGGGSENVDVAVNTIVQATIEQINSFDTELQNYESMTVAEIMEIRAIIDQLLEEREQLLENAHVLPDGTHVFETEDGSRVYYEDGTLVPENIIGAGEISNDRTKWESIRRNSDALDQQNIGLEIELENLESTRNLRDEIAKDGISVERLGELRQQHNARKSDTIRIKEASINPELLPAKPTQQFKMAAATPPSTSSYDLNNLNINAPSLNG